MKWTAPKVLATLTTKVRTSTRGGPEHEHPVMVLAGDLGYILRIDGTPGSWYLSTLVSDKGVIVDAIAVDFGQGWNAYGMRAAVCEALALILSGKLPL